MNLCQVFVNPFRFARAVDKFPASIQLVGAADDARMRLAQGKSEVVFWREERLIRQRNLLRSRMK